MFSATLQKNPSGFGRLSWTVVGVWAAVVIAAFGSLSTYAGKAGPTADAIEPGTGRSPLVGSSPLPTLLLFLHPHCPCSRATLAELSLAAARCQGRFVGHIVFVKPRGAEPGWERSELRAAAEAVPGFDVRTDDDAVEARQLSVTTSGHALLFAPDGKLLFSGGLTRSRGHAGDNPGRSAVVSLLLHDSAVVNTMPVFGCSLY